FADGRIGKALDLDGRRYADAGNVGDFGFDDRFSFSLWVNPRKPNGAILSRMAEEEHGEGYSIQLVGGKVQVHLSKRWLDDELRIYGRVIHAEEAVILSAATTPARILRSLPKRRTAVEFIKLRAFFLETAAPKHIREAYAANTAAQDALLNFQLSIPTVMVM